MIEQLWYTWSGTGIDGSLAGFQIRAASPGLLYQSEAFYQSVQDYVIYQLPDKVDPDTPDGPVCLALLDSPFNSSHGKILLRKVCAGRDPFGRPGNFFTHMLLGLPESFSARDAIHLWNAPFWRSRDVPVQEQSRKLPLLSLDELKPLKQRFRFMEVREELRMLITAFLSPGRLDQRVVIEGDSLHIAMLIWGLTHCLPTTLFPTGFTFSTYEYDVKGAQLTIVGTTDANRIYSHTSGPPVVRCSPPSYGYVNADLEADIRAFTAFATESLLQASDGYAPKLQNIITPAEIKGITTVEEFMALFRGDTQPAALPPVAMVSPPALEKSASSFEPSSSSPATHLSQFPPVVPQAPAQPVAPHLTSGSPPLIQRKETPNPPPSQTPAQPDTFSQEKAPDHFQDDFLRFGNRFSYQRSKSRLYLVVLVVILMLFSYLLGRVTGGGGKNNVNAATISAAARAQALATVSAQQTASAQATEKALITYETAGDYDVVFGYAILQGDKVLPLSPAPTIPVGSPFTVSILFLNTGSSAWTAPGYTLVCVPSNDIDCQSAQFQGLMSNSVQPGQMYTFSVMLTAKNPGSRHIMLSVAHNGKPIGASKKIIFSVSSS